jgi:hypothetical protein
MQRLEVSCVVRPIYGSLGAKGFNSVYGLKRKEIRQGCTTPGSQDVRAPKFSTVVARMCGSSV